MDTFAKFPKFYLMSFYCWIKYRELTINLCTFSFVKLKGKANVASKRKRKKKNWLRAFSFRVNYNMGTWSFQKSQNGYQTSFCVKKGTQGPTSVSFVNSLLVCWLETHLQDTW